jgi:phospholipase C
MYNYVDPPTNAGLPAKSMHSPYNRPAVLPFQAPMDGFVRDYINNFIVTQGRTPTYQEFSVIMQSFAPDTIPVLSTLAREFAVFDHWFCSVPSQTYCNRSFFNAATSAGLVLNDPVDNWIEDNRAPTIFNALEAKGYDWAIYYDAENFIPLTVLISSHQLLDHLLTRTHHMDRFYDDVQQGRLPPYSFVEPRFLFQHNDQHPPSKFPYGPTDPGTVLLGDRLIGEVYNAIRTSNSPTGSNWKNTLLLITHDEHGGCYDHVSPQPAVPLGGGGQNQMDFPFNQTGVRVSMVAVSAYINRNSIIHTPHEHTAVLKTIETRWKLDPLTRRDAAASDIGEVFNLGTPRDPNQNWPDGTPQWPVIQPRELPSNWQAAFSLDDPLNPLQRSMVQSAAALAQAKSLAAAAAPPIETIGQAREYIRSVAQQLR